MNPKLAALAVISASWAARAETAAAMRPGLMCENEQSLATLTLSDGGSRAGSPQEKPGDQQEATRGKCIYITIGTTVTIITTRAHTSIATFDPNDGGGPRRYFVPNIDFDIPGVPNPNPPDPLFQFYAELHKQCPANNWEKAYNGEFEAPIDQATARLTARQRSVLHTEVEKECGEPNGTNCRNNMVIQFAVQQGLLPQLLRAFCSIKPDVRQ